MKKDKFDEILDEQLRLDGIVEIQNSDNVYERSKRRIIRICDKLKQPRDHFDVEGVVTAIHAYVTNSELYMGKILYSEITSKVYGMNEDELSSILVNCEQLREYSLNPENCVDNTVFHTIIKICDHVSLAVQQISLTNDRKLIEYSEKQDKLIKQLKQLEDELKSTKTDYVTTLGLFSGIVLTFFGGLVFSSSVLENIHQASAYRLAIIALLIAALVLNVVFICFWAIDRIVHKDKRGLSKWPWIITDIVIAAFMGLTLYFYFHGTLEHRDSQLNATPVIQETTEGQESIDNKTPAED